MTSEILFLDFMQSSTLSPQFFLRHVADISLFLSLEKGRTMARNLIMVCHRLLWPCVRLLLESSFSTIFFFAWFKEIIYSRQHWSSKKGSLLLLLLLFLRKKREEISIFDSLFSFRLVHSFSVVSVLFFIDWFFFSFCEQRVERSRNQSFLSVTSVSSVDTVHCLKNVGNPSFLPVQLLLCFSEVPCFRSPFCSRSSRSLIVVENLKISVRTESKRRDPSDNLYFLFFSFLSYLVLLWWVENPTSKGQEGFRLNFKNQRTVISLTLFLLVSGAFSSQASRSKPNLLFGDNLNLAYICSHK